MRVTDEKKHALRWAQDKAWRKRTYQDWSKVSYPRKRLHKLRKTPNREQNIARLKADYEAVQAAWPLGELLPQFPLTVWRNTGGPAGLLDLSQDVLLDIVQQVMDQPPPNASDWPVQERYKAKRNTYFNHPHRMAASLARTCKTLRNIVILHFQRYAQDMFHIYFMQGVKGWHRPPPLFPLDEPLVRKLNIYIPLDRLWGVQEATARPLDAYLRSLSMRKELRRLRNVERHFGQFPNREFSRMSLCVFNLRYLPTGVRTMNRRLIVDTAEEHRGRGLCQAVCWPGERDLSEARSVDSTGRDGRGNYLSRDRIVGDFGYNGDPTDFANPNQIADRLENEYIREKQYYREPVNKPRRIDHLFLRTDHSRDPARARYSQRDRQALFDFTARYPDAKKVTVEMSTNLDKEDDDDTPGNAAISTSACRRARHLATNIRRRHMRSGRTGIAEFRLNIRYRKPGYYGRSDPRYFDYWVVRHKYFPLEDRWKWNEENYALGFPDEEAELNFLNAPVSQQRLAVRRVSHHNQAVDGDPARWHSDSTASSFGKSDRSNDDESDTDSMREAPTGSEPEPASSSSGSALSWPPVSLPSSPSCSLPLPPTPPPREGLPEHDANEDADNEDDEEDEELRPSSPTSTVYFADNDLVNPAYLSDGSDFDPLRPNRLRDGPLQPGLDFDRDPDIDDPFDTEDERWERRRRGGEEVDDTRAWVEEMRMKWVVAEGRRRRLI